MTIILHITPRADWESAQAAGQYRAESLATQGFIHCSTADQVVRVADVVFRGQSGLVLLVIDPDRLASRLVFEPPVNPHTGTPEPGIEEQFPHIYGPLNTDSVIRVLDFPPNPDGTFTLPSGAR